MVSVFFPPNKGECFRFSDMAGEGLSNKDNWVVVLGEHYQGIMDGTEQFVYIDKLIRHPDFVREYLIVES